MEEKKLTDEEVAKAILQSIEYSKTITYFDEWGNCKSIMVTDILNLIHRLQSENESLKKREKIAVENLFDRLKRNTHQGVDGGGFFVEITLRLEDLNWIKERYGVEVE